MKGVSFFVILDTLVGRYYAGNYHLFRFLGYKMTPLAKWNIDDHLLSDNTQKLNDKPITTSIMYYYYVLQTKFKAIILVALVFLVFYWLLSLFYCFCC